jgi:hypothetical protein
MLLESGRVSKLGPDLEAGLWNMMTAGGTLPLKSQQANTNPPTAHSALQQPPSGTAKPAARRHQPIIIKDPRMSSNSWAQAG